MTAPQGVPQEAPAPGIAFGVERVAETGKPVNVVLQINAGSGSFVLRVAPHDAVPLGQAIAQGLAATADQVAGELAGAGGLILPNGASRLVVPHPVIRPENNGGQPT